jgi:tRNA-2-methylthio-N6-dimethylallyladenosine synthase
MNISDSERLSAYLKSHGLVELDSRLDADIVAINTCGVRQSAEDRAYGIAHKLRIGNPDAKIIIMGCISHRPEVRSRLKKDADLFIANSEIPNLLPILRGDDDNVISFDELRNDRGEKYLKIVPDYKNYFSALIPIGNGCNNFCSYCVVPYARGREVYRPAVEIIDEIEHLVGRGYKEVILIAQNVNSYRSGDYSFARLLGEIASLSGDFWVRFFSSHPKDMSDELIEAMGRYKKVCPHLHLAVQSGDNEILQRMNRNYTANHYVSLIEKVRKLRPGIAITTDAIVGFPGETEDQFENTAQLFEQVKFDMAYIAQYSPRPHTAAWIMEDNVSRQDKRKRERRLTEILSRTGLEANRQYVGKTLRVLVDGRDKSGCYIGKTESYKTVLIKGSGNRDLMGLFVDVEILLARNFRLEGSLKIK